MTGLEALNKFVNIFAEYCVKTQYQEMNATNMQTAVEYLARSKECRTIEKSLKALEIIKEKRIDIESFYSSFIERDFNYNFYSSWYRGYGRNKLTEEEFNLLKEVLE